MQIIYKYKLTGMKTTLRLPKQSVFLNAAIDPSNELVVYVKQLKEYYEIEDRNIVMYGTGWEIPEDKMLNYISTVKQDICMWHIFEDTTNV